VKVIVAGAGVGGLATALALSLRGLEPVVLERAAELREAGAGITLWPNAMSVLRGLGVADAVASAGAPSLSGGIRAAGGRYLLRGPARVLERRFPERGVALHRAELQRILVSALGPGVVRLGSEVTGFEAHPDGVEARLAGGGREWGDALVGADGIWSTVRAGLWGAARPRYAGYTAWRAVVPFELGSEESSESWGRGERFGIVPIGGGRVYWFATANAPEGGRDEGGALRELRRRFGAWHAPIPALLEATPERAILRTDLYDREPLARWGDGPVTLLGDAAHPMTPNLGQGACQALEDAAALAGRLAGAADPASALRVYEDRRAPRTARLVRQSRLLGRVGQLDGALACRARDVLLRLTPPAVQLRQLETVVGSAQEGAGR
jgi:2-polyprenyl-6-methoxyphenol hydroxylase-like FAD-dependent oxidoreductase